MKKDYIDTKVIQEFSKGKGIFDFRKLIILLRELNDNYKRGNIYSCATIIRAVLDHIPPLLGHSNFNDVVNSYRWNTTDKSMMKSLLDFKLDAHDILHRPISNKHIPFRKQDLPKPRRLHILLNECLEHWDKKGKLITKKTTEKKPKIMVSLKEKKVSWAKYAVGRYVWSCFKIVLNIDNFNHNRGDYVNVSLKAISSDPEDSWEATHYIFELPEIPDKSSPNKPFEIEANKDIDVQVFISDLDVGHNEKRDMPKFSKDRLVLSVETKSRKKFSIPIKPGWIVLG